MPGRLRVVGDGGRPVREQERCRVVRCSQLAIGDGFLFAWITLGVGRVSEISGWIPD